MDAEAFAAAKKTVLEEIRRSIRECMGRRWHSDVALWDFKRYQWWDMYFGNFASKLPGGHVRAMLYDIRKNWGEEAFEAGNRMVPATCSERRRGMTQCEFFSDIDASLNEAGLDTGRILALQTEIYGGSQTARRKLMGYVFPAYVGLRAKGYSLETDLST